MFHQQLSSSLLFPEVNLVSLSSSTSGTTPVSASSSKPSLVFAVSDAYIHSSGLGSVVGLLLTAYPQSIDMPNHKGRTPMVLAQ